jgi:hypothetical protein
MAPNTVRGTMVGNPEAIRPAEALTKARLVGFIWFHSTRSCWRGTLSQTRIKCPADHYYRNCHSFDNQACSRGNFFTSENSFEVSNIVVLRKLGP